MGIFVFVPPRTCGLGLNESSTPCHPNHYPCWMGNPRAWILFWKFFLSALEAPEGELLRELWDTGEATVAAKKPGSQQQHRHKNEIDRERERERENSWMLCSPHLTWGASKSFLFNLGWTSSVYGLTIMAPSVCSPQYTHEPQGAWGMQLPQIGISTSSS